jgi:hypothetical protein
MSTIWGVDGGFVSGRTRATRNLTSLQFGRRILESERRNLLGAVPSP